MQVFLQNQDTGQLLGERNAWVLDEHEALNFRSSVAALGHYRRCRLGHAQVLLRMDGARRDLDVVLPLDRH